MLTRMSQRLCRTTTFGGAIRTILDDVIALLGAEHGNVQMLVGDELAIVAQRDLDLEFLRAFWRVSRNDGSACGRALRLGAPVVISDVENDAEFAGFRDVARRAGFRAVQSTPFVTRDRIPLGIVSTHFANVHSPTAIEMQTLKEYGIVAAEYVVSLLGDTTLSEAAESMSDALYASMLRQQSGAGISGASRPSATRR